MPRQPRAPGWVVLPGLAWGAAVLALELWRRAGGPALGLCHLRRLTGIPCPTCGGTRATFALLEGRMLEALLLNPLVVISLLSAGFWLVTRLWLGPRLALRLTARQRRCLPWLLGLAVAANWAYVLARDAAY